MKKPRPKYRRKHAHSKDEHRLIAERILGRPLKSSEVVHHIDGDGRRNSHDNLIICTQAYHNLIHARERAYAACGHAHWKVCVRCGKYDNPDTMQYHGPASFVHAECQNAHTQKYVQRNHEVVKAKRRAYWKNNKTACNERQRQRYAERITDPAYRERFRESVRLAMRRFRARKKAAARELT